MSGVRCQVSDFSREERLVVILRYCERLTWAETAAVLGIDVQRVRVIHDRVFAEVERRVKRKAAK